MSEHTPAAPTSESVYSKYADGIKARMDAARSKYSEDALAADKDMARFEAMIRDRISPAAAADFRESVREPRLREIRHIGRMTAAWWKETGLNSMHRFIEESKERSAARALGSSQLEYVAGTSETLRYRQTLLRELGPDAKGISRSNLWKEVEALYEEAAWAISLIGAHLTDHPDDQFKPLATLATQVSESLEVIKDFDEHKFFG